MGGAAPVATAPWQHTPPHQPAPMGPRPAHTASCCRGKQVREWFCQDQCLASFFGVRIYSTKRTHPTMALRAVLRCYLRLAARHPCGGRTAPPRLATAAAATPPAATTTGTATDTDTHHIPVVDFRGYSVRCAPTPTSRRRRRHRWARACGAEQGGGGVAGGRVSASGVCVCAWPAGNPCAGGCLPGRCV